MRPFLALTPLLIALPACGIYFGEGDDCDFGGALENSEAPGAFELPRRNPETGVCEQGGIRPPTCGDPCAPCTNDDGDFVPARSWGFCNGVCEALDEATCLVTTGCRAAYVRTCQGLGCPVDDVAFYECWSTDETGPIQGGECTGLDATTCSLHDDCVAIHGNAGCAVDAAGVPVECDPLGLFERCAPESDDSPAQGTCDGTVVCDVPPPDCPVDTLPGIQNGCYTGFCIPVTAC